MRDVRYPIGSRFQEWTRRVSQLAQAPVPFPLLLTSYVLLPFFFFCFLFPDSRPSARQGGAQGEINPFSFVLRAVYQTFNRRHFNGWEKRADSGAEWPSWNVRVGGSPWVGAWDGLGFTRRLDHLLSLLGVPVIFCPTPVSCLREWLRAVGGLLPGRGVVASVHRLFCCVVILSMARVVVS